MAHVSSSWWLSRAIRCLLAGLVATAVGGDALAARASLFGTREVHATNLAPFPKWLGAIERYFGDRAEDDGPCQVRTLNRCNLEAWKAVLDGLAAAPARAQLDGVNRYMNHAPYITDPRNYGMEDYWAAPREFFHRDGDCEDYAIAKFFSLRALGWNDDDLRVVVLQDTNLGVPHAVLAAYVEGKPYILDNQVDQVVAADRIRHYQPLFSINESGWWLHKP
jgi:predicted transglutaminase-like cysteine proteinase